MTETTATATTGLVVKAENVDVDKSLKAITHDIEAACDILDI